MKSNLKKNFDIIKKSIFVFYFIKYEQEKTE